MTTLGLDPLYIVLIFREAEIVKAHLIQNFAIPERLRSRFAHSRNYDVLCSEKTKGDRSSTLKFFRTFNSTRR